MKNPPLGELLELSIPERIRLVEDIWDSIIEVPESISLTDAQKEELDRRLQAYYKNQNESLPWDQVCARIEKNQ
ncbi:MAG: addiction module protein [Deltaproteobacteria bacterium]|nr:addiction module protein [Deltaproteobacteria bacterium]